MNAPSLAMPMLLSAMLGAGAFLAGWLGNREEYGAFWIIFAACCLRVFVPLALPARLAAVSYAADVTLMALGFVLGFWIGRERWWTCTRSWSGWRCRGLRSWCWARPSRGGSIAGRRRAASPAHTAGGCRYHLRGVTNWRCPECGRPFTLKELGVSPSELRAEA